MSKKILLKQITTEINEESNIENKIKMLDNYIQKYKTELNDWFITSNDQNKYREIIEKIEKIKKDLIPKYENEIMNKVNQIEHFENKLKFIEDNFMFDEILYKKHYDEILIEYQNKCVLNIKNTMEKNIEIDEKLKYIENTIDNIENKLREKIRMHIYAELKTYFVNELVNFDFETMTSDTNEKHIKVKFDAFNKIKDKLSKVDVYDTISIEKNICKFEKIMQEIDTQIIMKKQNTCENDKLKLIEKYKLFLSEKSHFINASNKFERLCVYLAIEEHVKFNGPIWVQKKNIKSDWIAKYTGCYKHNCQIFGSCDCCSDPFCEGPYCKICGFDDYCKYAVEKGDIIFSNVKQCIGFNIFYTDCHRKKIKTRMFS